RAADRPFFDTDWPSFYRTEFRRPRLAKPPFFIPIARGKPTWHRVRIGTATMLALLSASFPATRRRPTMQTRALFCVIWTMLITAGLLFDKSRSAIAADTDPIKVELRKFDFKVPNEQASLFGYDDGEGRLFYYTKGLGETTVKLPADGDYEITIRASCDPALNERAKFKLTLDG